MRHRGEKHKVLAGGVAAFAVSLALSSCAQPASQSAAVSKDAAASPSRAAALVEPDGGAPKHLRILTSDQYLNSLAYVFGEDIRLQTDFAPLPRADGLLASGAALAGFTGGQIEQYYRTGSTVAGAAVDAKRREFLINCKPADARAADRACATKFLGSVGRILYRGRLTDALLADAVNKASEAADRLKDFYAGLSSALEGMLSSPQVLFVAETSEPDPLHPGQERLDAYSLASRLSLLLWNAVPDDTLLKAAESGELMTEKGRAATVDRMLASPRLEAGVRAFFDDMFGFDQFATLAKDSIIYQSFSAVTAQDAREQTLRTIVDQLLVKKRDYRDLYTTRETFLSPALGAIYGVKASGWMPYTAPPDSPRAGLLTQISFLALHSHPGRSSPTLRGKALRELVLCQPVPPPPANVDFSALENPDPNIKTQRARLEIHRTNPVCAGCHKITDPMGLALEHFDGSGQYRETEKGAPIDTSGSLDNQPFADAAGLGASVRTTPALTSCLVKRIYGYATGGPTAPGDQATLAYFGDIFARAGYRLPDLLRSIAMSKTFAAVREAPVSTKTASLAP